MIKHLPIIMIALLLTACSAVGTRSVDVTGLDDAFATDIEVSSYDYERPLLGVSTHGTGDGFFRAYIDKETKRTTYQLYAIMHTSDWYFWDGVRFFVDGQLIQREANRIAGKPDCSQYGCSTYEDVIVQLKRDELNSLRNSNELEFRFTSSSMSGFGVVKLSGEELRAFLSLVDMHRGHSPEQ